MIYIILLLVILLLVGIILIYNGLVKQRNMVNNQKSQIDIQLKRRFDLIPNLVEVVKGYSKYEKSTLEDIVFARNKYVSANNDTEKQLEADTYLNNALSKLFVLVESYPHLKANQNLLNLQKELSTTEDKVAFSRQFYNDAVYKLNTKIQVFPSNLIASIFKFKEERYFEINSNEKENININI